MDIPQGSILRILDGQGTAVGTGFYLSPHLAVTCAQVILSAGAAPGGQVKVSLGDNAATHMARVLAQNDSSQEDIAFLALDDQAGNPVSNASGNIAPGTAFTVVGFQAQSSATGSLAERALHGQFEAAAQAPGYARPMLALNGPAFSPGFRGAPVVVADLVVGMLSLPPDPGMADQSPAYLIPMETIYRIYTARLNPAAGQTASDRPQFNLDHLTATDNGVIVVAGEDANVTIQKMEAPKKTPIPRMAEEPPPVFVGREALLADLVSKLQLGRDDLKHLPVLALHGMGGIGKTCLAAALTHLEVVESALPDGTLWATFGPQPDVMLWLATWGYQLGADLTAYPTLETRSRALATLVHDKKALLVIDDVWNAADARWLLVGGAGSRAILTTRDREVAQGLSGGQEVQVPVLGQAVDLLRLLAPEPVNADPAATQELANFLGGLPLALKLAGSLLAKEWKNSFGPREVVADLEDRKRRLGLVDDQYHPGISGLPSLEAILRLSYDHLATEQERDCFHTLSVFGGEPNTFTLQAAAAVWDLADPRARQALSALSTQALVQVAGNGRYSLQKLVADFAEERTPAEEKLPAQLRHSQHFLGTAQKYQSNNLDQWDQLDLDWRNIQLGMGTTQAGLQEENASPEALQRVMQYARALEMVISKRRPAEGMQWLTAGVNACQRLGENGEAAWFNLAQGSLALNQGNTDQAETFFRHSAAVFEREEIMDGLCYAQGNLGIVEHVRDQYDSAFTSYLKATQLSEAGGDPLGAAVGYYNLGSVSLHLGKIALAIHYLRRCIHSCALLEGSQDFIARANSRLAECRLEQGRLRQAALRAEVGLRQAEESKLADLIGYAHQVRAQVFASRGEAAPAEEHFLHSLDWLEDALYPEEFAQASLQYGKFLARLAKPEAHNHLARAKQIFVQLEASHRAGVCQRWLEQLNQTKGDIP